VLEAVRRCPAAVEYASDELRADPVVRMALKKFPWQPVDRG
jgi:hypothetical protein